MEKGKKPSAPVRPTGMEVLYFYACPFCGRDVPVAAPVQPAMVKCDVCAKHFPIVPVDERSVRFIKTMLANGRAGIDPDFL